MTATIEPSPIVRALRAAHLHDAPRRQLLQLACDRLRALGAPYTSVYAYMLHGDALALQAFAGRETEHTRIPVGTGVCGTAAGSGASPPGAHAPRAGSYPARHPAPRSELPVLIARRP